MCMHHLRTGEKVKDVEHQASGGNIQTLRLSMFGLGEVLGIGPEMSDGVGWDGAYCRGRRVCGEYKDYFREGNVRAK